MGYPATGHVTRRVSPATADISSITRINGVPEAEIANKSQVIL